MKPSLHLSLLASGLALLSLPLHAATLTWDIAPGSIGVGDSAVTGGSGTWDTSIGNWTTDGGLNNIAWVNATDAAIFEGTAGTVTLGSAVTANSLTFNTSGYALIGGALTLAGTTPTLVGSADASIASSLVGTVGLVKTGTGTLTLTGANTYSGVTNVNAGVLAYGGTGSNTASGILTVQGGGVLNVATSGSLTFSGAGPHQIGNGTAGVINQSSGTLTLNTNNTGYVQLGSGSVSSYGACQISGGTLTLTPATGTAASGFRLAGNGGGAAEAAGVGMFLQTGGAFSVGRYFAVGGGGAAGPGTAIATFSGGTAAIGSAGYRMIICDRANSSGTVNIGTSAGGNATVTASLTTGNQVTPTGVVVGGATPATATLNINSGVLLLNAGGIIRSNGTGVVNFNGGTVRAGVTGLTLINTTLTSVNVYNGGAVFDTQAFATSTVSANLLKPNGNGIYVPGGTLAVGGGGSGYIGAPAVAVTGGSGSGAMAIANVSGGVITGVSISNPGQNYAVGDSLSFTFTGGGATSPAGVFNYVLTASDVAANATGGVTKLGTGSLTLSGANTYTGATNVNAGTLSVSGTYAGPFNVNAGTLSVSGGSLGAATAAAGSVLTVSGSPAMASLSFSGSATLNMAPLSGVTPGIAVGGAVSTSGTETINLTNALPLTPGSYRLISYGSTAGSGLGAFTLGTVPPLGGARARTYTLDTTNPGYLGLNVVGESLTWTGATDGAWDTTTQNWKFTTAGTAINFATGDDVFFDNSATVRNITVNTSDVTPSSVTFDNNTSNNFSLSGSFGLAGTSALVKTGLGTLTVSSVNSFTGPLSVRAGTLAVATVNNASASGPLGNSATAVSLGDSGNSTGTLAYTGATASSTKPFSLAAGGAGAFQVDSAGAALTLGGVISGAGSLSKTGPGTLILTGVNTYTGTTVVSEGAVQLTTAAGETIFGNGGSLILGGGTVRHSGGNSGADGNAWNRSITVSGSGTMDNANTATFVHYSGILSGTGTLNLTTSSLSGTKEWLVSGNSTASFSGPVNLGATSGATIVLQIRNGGQIGTGSITMNPNGVLSTDTGISATINNPLVLNGGQIKTQNLVTTYTGSLTAGAATSSTLAPSGNAAATLTFTGNLGGSGIITESTANPSTTGAVVLAGNNSGFTGTYNQNGAAITQFAGPDSGSAAATWTISNGSYVANVAGTPVISLGSLSGTGTLGNLMAGSIVTYSVGALNATTSFSGAIQDGAGVTALAKVGTGTLNLPVANAYSGGTTVSGGVLNPGAASSLGTGPITVNGGILNLNGFTFAPSNTIAVGAAGTLSGAGTLAPSGNMLGTLSPGGTGAAGRIIFTNSLTLGPAAVLNLEIGGTAGGSFDVVETQGEIALAGTANLSLINGFSPALGDSFDLIADDGGQSGSVTLGTLPTLGAGLAWNTAAFATSGVVSIVNSDPVTAYVSGPPYNLTGNDALPGADPDGDGISNAMEYAFGTSPIANNGPEYRGVASTTSGALTLTYRRPLNGVSGVTYGVEFKTADLVVGNTGWTPGVLNTDYTQSVTPNGDGTTETVTITLSGTVSGKKFARVSVAY